MKQRGAAKMVVEDIMSERLFTCRPDDSLNDAARQMWEANCGCMPVVGESGEAIGVITDRDICMAAYIQGRPLWEISIGSAMGRPAVVCQAKDDLTTAEALMREHQVRRLPVVNSEGQVIAVISLNDIALECERQLGKRRKDVDARQVAETLAAICAHPNGLTEAPLLPAR